MTAHAAQGQTLPAAIVDLQIGQSTNAIASYEALTRVPSREDPLIYRSFASDLHTQGEPEGTELREESKWTGGPSKPNILRPVSAHKPHFPQDPQVFSGILTTTWCDPQRSVSPWSAWRREAWAAKRSRRRMVCRCRQRSAGCRGCARMATWRRNIGRPRGAEAGVCVMCSLHVSSLISRRVICVSRLWVHGCNEERVRAASLINAWISVDPCCTVASVRKLLQASGIERSRRSLHEYVAAGHWPAKQVISG